VPLSTLVRALVVLLVTLLLAYRIRPWFERATANTKADASTRLAVGRLLEILVLVVGGVTLLDTLGIALGAVVTFLGVVGLAITLALQDILRNFFAGLYLLFERPFRLGDSIAIRDQRGVVETIGIRTTTLRTQDNVQVLIPNMIIFAELVLNRTEVVSQPPDAATAPAEPPVPTRSAADQPASLPRSAAGQPAAPAESTTLSPAQPDRPRPTGGPGPGPS
jgi:small-conductance mechanosensitive channel